LASHLRASLDEIGCNRTQLDGRASGGGRLMPAPLVPSQQRHGVRQRGQPRNQFGSLERVIVRVQSTDCRKQSSGCP
jgi:hypothetical protein